MCRLRYALCRGSHTRHLRGLRRAGVVGQSVPSCAIRAQLSGVSCPGASVEPGGGDTQARATGGRGPPAGAWAGMCGYEASPAIVEQIVVCYFGTVDVEWDRKSQLAGACGGLDKRARRGYNVSWSRYTRRGGWTMHIASSPVPCAEQRQKNFFFVSTTAASSSSVRGLAKCSGGCDMPSGRCAPWSDMSKRQFTRWLRNKDWICAGCRTVAYGKHRQPRQLDYFTWVCSDACEVLWRLRNG